MFAYAESEVVAKALDVVGRVGVACDQALGGNRRDGDPHRHVRRPSVQHEVLNPSGGGNVQLVTADARGAAAVNRVRRPPVRRAADYVHGVRPIESVLPEITDRGEV